MSSANSGHRYGRVVDDDRENIGFSIVNNPVTEE